MNLFLTNTFCFTKQKVNCLDSHSDAEDLLVSKWRNDKFLQICSCEETNLSTTWMFEGGYICSKFSFWGELFL